MDANPSEAVVVVNGTQLSHAQAMTMRVALLTFSMSLREEGLGSDNHGKTMVDLYEKNISDIMQIMRVPENLTKKDKEKDNGQRA